MTSGESEIPHILAQPVEPEVNYGACAACPRLRQALAAIANNRDFYERGLKQIGDITPEFDEVEHISTTERERSVNDYLHLLGNLSRFESSIEGRKKDIAALRQDCIGVNQAPSVRFEVDGSHTETNMISCGSPSLPESTEADIASEPVIIVRKRIEK